MSIKPLLSRLILKNIHNETIEEVRILDYLDLT